MGLTFDDVRDMALQGAQLVRDPTQSEVDAFRLAMGGRKGLDCVSPHVIRGDSSRFA